MFRSLHRLIAPKPRTLERDEIPLLLESGTRIAIQRVRDPRAKRIKLSVDERGARLTLPMRASLVSGDRFLHEHRDWLSLQLEKYTSRDTAPALARNLTRTLPLRGEEQPLHWHEGRYTRVVLDADGLHFHAPDGSLALDLALVLGRASAFEYVLVHELCHLIHANHSPAFWREVEARFPAWPDERVYFHAQGRRLKASLRALLTA